MTVCHIRSTGVSLSMVAMITMVTIIQKLAQYVLLEEFVIKPLPSLFRCQWACGQRRRHWLKVPTYQMGTPLLQGVLTIVEILNDQTMFFVSKSKSSS